MRQTKGKKKIVEEKGRVRDRRILGVLNHTAKVALQSPLGNCHLNCVYSSNTEPQFIDTQNNEHWETNFV